MNSNQRLKREMETTMKAICDAMDTIRNARVDYLKNKLGDLDHPIHKELFDLYWEGERQKHQLKMNLLRQYADREPHEIMQYDCYGPSLPARMTVELMDGSHLKVLIPTEIAQEEALKYLERITELVRNSWMEEVPF